MDELAFPPGIFFPRPVAAVPVSATPEIGVADATAVDRDVVGSRRRLLAEGAELYTQAAKRQNRAASPIGSFGLDFDLDRVAAFIDTPGICPILPGGPSGPPSASSESGDSDGTRSEPGSIASGSDGITGWDAWAGFGRETRRRRWFGYDSWKDWWAGKEPANRRTNTADEEVARAMLARFDDGGAEEDVVVPLQEPLPRCRGRILRPSRFRGQAKRGYGIAAKIAREAKGEFFRLDHTKANVMCVARFMRNRLRELGYAPDVICDIVCVAEALFWVPTQREEEVSRVTATLTYTNAFASREDAYRDGYRWGVTRWLEDVGVIGRAREYGPRPSA